MSTPISITHLLCFLILFCFLNVSTNCQQSHPPQPTSNPAQRFQQNDSNPHQLSQRLLQGKSNKAASQAITVVTHGAVTVTRYGNTGPPIGISVQPQSSGVAVSQASQSVVSSTNSPDATVSVENPQTIDPTLPQQKRHGRPNLAIIQKSTDVAVSQGSGSAVVVDNSANSNTAVGGATNVNSGAGFTTGNKIMIKGATGLAVSQGSGAAVVVADSPNSGVGVGGAANVNTDSAAAPNTGTLSLSGAINAAISQGSGAAVVVSNSPLAGVGVGGAANVGATASTGATGSQQVVGTGTASASGSGAAVVVGSSPQAGVGVGGVANVGGYP